MLVYREGFPEWKKRGYPVESIPDFLPLLDIPALRPDELKALLAGPERPVLLDLRDREDIQASGTIAGALNIPLENLMADHGRIPQGQRVVLVDMHGVQYPLAGRYLVKQGFAKVSGLGGGIKSWIEAGFPVSK
ncbi:MAG TPA: rhodanese-like domain-containing protein [Candidatus Methanoperedens sp.]|nr:rhodanese-like domain-containing protein [Candidatus Methanoperedens sp.]